MSHNATSTKCIRCLSQAKFHCLHAWDAYFYIGMPTLFVKRGICMGCLFSQRDAHIYCANGHPGARIYVNIGIGHRDAYIHVNTGTRDAYFWGCLYSLDTGYLLPAFSFRLLRRLLEVFFIRKSLSQHPHLHNQGSPKHSGFEHIVILYVSIQQLASSLLRNCWRQLLCQLFDAKQFSTLICYLIHHLCFNVLTDMEVNPNITTFSMRSACSSNVFWSTLM